MDLPPLIIRHEIELSVSKTNFSFLKHLFCWYEGDEFSYYLYKRFGNVKIWSPNASGNPRAGETLFKFGSYNRFDVEASRMLHVAWKLFGIKVNHFPFGTIVAGVIGGL